MNQNKNNDLDFTAWYSTYGILTVERVLGKFNLQASHEILHEAIKDKHSAYFQFLQLPFKNILNGIILDQTQDYQSYAQKLFVDYLLSGQNEKEEGAAGAHICQSLEEERRHLMAIGDDFNQQISAHQMLIAESQQILMTMAAKLKRNTLSGEEVAFAMGPFHPRADELTRGFRASRKAMHELILNVTRLLDLLPDYVIDEKRTDENLSVLNFDSSIGEAHEDER